LELGLEVYQPERVRLAESAERISGMKPDLIVVSAYGQILPASILTAPPFGCVNIHASLLPAFRGAAPIHRAIIQGERSTGVTIMQMEAGMDSGPILLQKPVCISQEMTAGELHDILAELGASALLEALPVFLDGRLKPAPQNPDLVSYAPMLKKDDEWIRWDQPVETVHNQIRGLTPQPGAMTLFKGKPLKICRAGICEAPEIQEAIQGRPGTVLKLLKDKANRGWAVETGCRGTLLVTSVKPEGAREMDALSFVNGYGLEVGYGFETRG
jgi:methionyl-tRNA formyltransferase